MIVPRGAQNLSGIIGCLSVKNLLFLFHLLPEETGLNHWHVWVDAILDGTPTSDGFHYAGPLTETVQLGNVAARLPGRQLYWDPTALRVTNVAEANPLLTKEYRPGWEIAPA